MRGRSANYWNKPPARKPGPRYSIKGLLYLTAFVACFAAILNNPGGPIVRMMTAQVIAMILLAVLALSVRDIVRTRSLRRNYMVWFLPTACFILLAWSFVQMVYTASQIPSN